MLSDDPASSRSQRVADDVVVRRHAPPGVATVESLRGRLVSALVVLVALALVVPATASAGAGRADAKPFAGLQKRLVSESRAHLAFIRRFRVEAVAYDRLASASSYDYAAMWQAKPGAVRRLLAQLKREWVVGNPLYERMEGIVAGVPSLRKYDVDIDAGTSYREDPQGAVSFSLKLSDGRTVRQPGAYYNITEAALWGEDRTYVVKAVRPDLNGELQGRRAPEAPTDVGSVSELLWSRARPPGRSLRRC